jgi:hypothetical protein
MFYPVSSAKEKRLPRIGQDFPGNLNMATGLRYAILVSRAVYQPRPIPLSSVKVAANSAH